MSNARAGGKWNSGKMILSESAHNAEVKCVIQDLISDAPNGAQQPTTALQYNLIAQQRKDMNMPTRQIITIDDEKCNGCGNCVTGCAEGALQIVNGKAKLVKEQFCDGFGDCIGTCPTDALKIEERESDEFDMNAVKQHLQETQGEEAVHRMEQASQRHANTEHTPHPMTPPAGGCPGTRMRFNQNADTKKEPTTASGMPGHINESDLQQWPVQIHLVQPGAPFFKNKELAVLSTCSPIASADLHWRFIRGRGVVVGCPKLDQTEGYPEKLGEILKDPTIPKVIVVRMEVPCCGGLIAIVKEAVRLSGRTDLEFEEVTVGLNGDIV
jgi:ferredoxin